MQIPIRFVLSQRFLAGIALTYLIVARKAKTIDGQLPVDKVVNLCNSAADKLDAFVSQAIAS